MLSDREKLLYFISTMNSVAVKENMPKKVRLYMFDHFRKTRARSVSFDEMAQMLNDIAQEAKEMLDSIEFSHDNDIKP